MRSAPEAALPPNGKENGCHGPDRGGDAFDPPSQSLPDQDPAQVAVAFLHKPPFTDLLNNVIAPGGEQVQRGRREIHIYYPHGMGRSKLKLSLSGATATVRNINIIAKLVAMTEG